MKNKLYIVSIPIGNKEDLSFRALEILRDADFIICEEFKPARRFLSSYKIEKELFSLNEHNEKESAPEIVEKIKSGEKAALISDAGTPLFSDPGHFLVELCISAGVEIVPVPGANSLLPALVGSGMDIEKFYYYGWLSPKKEIRRQELNHLKKKKDLIVLMETPYRLQKILADCSNAFGGKTNAVLAYKLTMPEEKFFRGNLEAITKEAGKKNLKGEFVLLIDNRN